MDRRQIALAVALLIAAALVARWTYRTTLVDEFMCGHVIEDRLGGASQICAGFDPLPSAVRGAAERLFIPVPDTQVDGLAPLVDPSLGTARRVVVGVGLLLVAVVSAVAVYVHNRLGQLGRLLNLDPEAWSAAARSTRNFAVVFLVLVGGLRVLVF